MSNNKNQKYPQINISNKTRIWERNNDYTHYFSRSEVYRDNLNKNKIVKIQKNSDMKTNV